MKPLFVCAVCNQIFCTETTQDEIAAAYYRRHGYPLEESKDEVVHICEMCDENMKLFFAAN